MARMRYILESVKELNIEEKEILLSYLEESILLGSFGTKLSEDVRESRFSKGKVCPHCKTSDISRNGKYNGKQRYICKTCRKSFNDFTKSPVSYSKKDLSKWIQYAKLMINGATIRKCAEILDINIATSFFWRHKILEGIKKFLGVGHVDGVVESDETFVLESYKGNHSKSKHFKMPRKAYRRGGRASKRGISNEQICISCSIDRGGNIISEVICRGRVKSDDLKKLYDNRIQKDSIFCTDSHKSYIRFAADLNLNHIRIKRGRRKEGIYHIQHINSYHSRLKEWMYKFHGVATKYLCNYLSWFRWLEYFKNDKEPIKYKNLITQSLSAYSKIRVIDFKDIRVTV
ncbi:IS1595 family transposase [Oceanirhabdus sp. W0125-5]|uniref:IS1595 family transposase n=1 Tax=Oceanirhabdus sp. W0125-5 TaxID=2999116 RepID=UPI0022F2D8D1|nr:IS1595 family transposase [Oceanirhabdus sp. W0125-5]WBW97504.1 IS1595 family transposase [Oceanirhabdus sp. W0125-5]